MEDEAFGTTSQSSVEWTVAAMNSAADRMRDVHWHDPVRAFATIGETLWWVCVLDEALQRRYGNRYLFLRDADEHVKQLLGGMRHARNRFAHSDEVLDFVEPSTLVGSNWSGGYTVGWKWNVLPPVPAGRGARGAQEYSDKLEGQDVWQSLVRGLSFLRGAAQQLSLIRQERRLLSCGGPLGTRTALGNRVS